MLDASALLYLTVETPLHAGADSSLGVVDNPIQRESPSQYPMIRESSLKGSLRTLARAKNLPNWELIFGPETENASEFGGALSVGDARMLLFPVRALTDVFVYTTSGDLLARYHNDTARGRAGRDDSTVPALAEVARGAALLTEQGIATHGDVLVLEEFPFTTSPSAAMRQIATALGQRIFAREQDNYWRRRLDRSLVALPDTDFRDFTLYSTAISTRLRLNEETKTVTRGALWTEEVLPPQTVLYALISATATRKVGEGVPTLSAHEVLEHVRQFIASSGLYLQLGGGESLGRGIVRTTWQALTPQ